MQRDGVARLRLAVGECKCHAMIATGVFDNGFGWQVGFRWSFFGDSLMLQIRYLYVWK